MGKFIRVAGENHIFVGRISSVAGINPLRLERRLELRFPSKLAPPPRLAISVKLSSFDSTYLLHRKSNKDDFEGFMKSLREIVKPAVIVAVFLALMVSGRRNSAWALTGGVIAGGDTCSYSSPSSSSSSWNSSSSSSSNDLYSYVYSNSSGSSSGSNCRCSCNRENSSSKSGGGELIAFFVTTLFLIWIYITIKRFIAAHFYVTLIKLQVATLDSGRNIQRDLNRIAETANASTTVGRQSILEETLKFLFEHFDECVAVNSTVKPMSLFNNYIEWYNWFSMKERKKFDEETFVNIDGNKKKITSIKQISWSDNEYTVVTLLILASGTHTFPTINSKLQLKKALKKLQKFKFTSDRFEKLQLLWAPQHEEDSLLHEELEKKYPDLRRLKS